MLNFCPSWIVVTILPRTSICVRWSHLSTISQSVSNISVSDVSVSVSVSSSSESSYLPQRRCSVPGIMHILLMRLQQKHVTFLGATNEGSERFFQRATAPQNAGVTRHFLFCTRQVMHLCIPLSLTVSPPGPATWPRIGLRSRCLNCSFLFLLVVSVNLPKFPIDSRYGTRPHRITLLA